MSRRVSLGTQKICCSCKDDDQPVADVDRLADDTPVVGRLTALNVSHDKAFGLIGFCSFWVGDSLDNLVGRDIESYYRTDSQRRCWTR